jgi:hypothetical protein
VLLSGHGCGAGCAMRAMRAMSGYKEEKERCNRSESEKEEATFMCRRLPSDVRGRQATFDPANPIHRPRGQPRFLAAIPPPPPPPRRAPSVVYLYLISLVLLHFSSAISRHHHERSTDTISSPTSRGGRPWSLGEYVGAVSPASYHPSTSCAC